MSICVCPSCGNEAQVLEPFRGKAVQCPHCAASFITPEQPAGSTSRLTGLLVVACPECRRQSCVTAEQKGKEVQCPHCGRRFAALAAPASPASSPRRGESIKSPTFSPLGEKGRTETATPRPSSPVSFPRSSHPAEESPGIRFACPQCEHVLEVPADQAGTKLPCPSCGQRLKVPLAIDKTVYGKRLDVPAGPRPLSGLEPASLSASGSPAMPDVSSRPSPKDEGREETIRQLLVLAGPDKGKVFPLPETGTVRIGRAATAEIRLLDVRVSRAHCELQVTADQVILTAPEGQRSAYVNEVRVTADKLLSPGDILRVGETELRFDVPDVAGLKTIYGDVHEALREIAGEGKISVMCTCGQELVARARYAGTRVRCPACEEFVTLPGRAARTPHAEDSSVLTVEGKEEEMSLETNALPVTGRTNPVIIVALAAAGLLLLAALGVLYWIKMQS